MASFRAEWCTQRGSRGTTSPVPLALSDVAFATLPGPSGCLYPRGLHPLRRCGPAAPHLATLPHWGSPYLLCVYLHEDQGPERVRLLLCSLLRRATIFIHSNLETITLLPRDHGYHPVDAGDSLGCQGPRDFNLGSSRTHLYPHHWDQGHQRPCLLEHPSSPQGPVPHPLDHEHPPGQDSAGSTAARWTMYPMPLALRMKLTFLEAYNFTLSHVQALILLGMDR